MNPDLIRRGLRLDEDILKESNDVHHTSLRRNPCTNKASSV